MHNHYYFLKQLASTLEERVMDHALVSAFSQEKDELVLEFRKGKSHLFIRASLRPELAALSFPDTFHRARKNSVQLFNDLHSKRVTGVRQFINERSFGFSFEEHLFLLFKMHGRQANVILHKSGKVAELFRNNLKNDLKLGLETLDRPVDPTFEAFSANQGNMEKFYFFLGQPVWDYLNKHGFASLGTDPRWKLFKQTIRILDSPKYYLVMEKDTLNLSLFPEHNALSEFSDPIQAANEFFQAWWRHHAEHKERLQLHATLRQKITHAENVIKKAQQRLEQSIADRHFKEWGDLLMANLNIIQPGAELVQVQNLFEGKATVEIPLKRELSPQANAERYYQKSKNGRIEQERLAETIRLKDGELHALREIERRVLDAPDHAALRNIATSINRPETERANKLKLPYVAYEFYGYAVWVGKNSKANDEMTFHHAHKEDLWLHARDTPGSHVILRRLPGKEFSKDVIERAAALAAFHSKRKNESLCPVIYTPRKYVRKRKGDVPGAVRIERQKVILVEPAK